MRHHPAYTLNSRLSDLENQSCLDAERFYLLVRKARECKQRIANRKPEIERLRKEMWE